MMHKTAILELLANHQNSRVEFIRDDCRAEELAKEMSALLNLAGGIILLGVENGGQICGLSKSQESVQEWVMNVARHNIQPAVSPKWTCIELDDGKKVGVIELDADSPVKPHKAKLGRTWVSFTRVGSNSRKSTREEEVRLYQATGLVRYEIKAVPDTGFESLDMVRVENYYHDVLQRTTPDRSDKDSWIQLLLNSDLLVRNGNNCEASVSGLLLFGNNPNCRLPQSGVTAKAFPGTENEYDTIDEERIMGPLTSIVSKKGEATVKGVVDRTVDFVQKNMGSVAWIDGGRRRKQDAYPLDAVREVVVNAITHRDYTRDGTDIEVSLYRDRLEIIAPGNLPDGVTVAKMKQGIVRFPRNELLREILRDYGYRKRYGMGVRNRIIESVCRHNGSEPELLDQDDRFVVRIWKKMQSVTCGSLVSA